MINNTYSQYITKESKWDISLYIPALQWFFIALIIRLIALIIIHFYSIQAGFNGFIPMSSGGDDKYYYDVAKSMLNGNIPTTLPNYYPYFLTFLFFIFSPSLFLGQLANVLFSSITVYFGVLITREVSESTKNQYDLRNPVNIAGFLLSFYPSSIFYSTQLLKDPMLIMIGIISLYLLIRLFNNFKMKNLVMLIFTLIILSLLRGYTMLAILIASFIYILFSNRISFKYIIALLVLFATIPMIFGYGIFGLNFINNILNPKKLSTIRDTVYSIGGSAAGIKIDFSSIYGFIFTYGYSFITAMFGPLPWQIENLTIAIGLIDAIIVWVLIPKFIKGVKNIFDRRNITIKELVFLFSFILIAAIALFSDNIGANTRLRMLAWDAFFIYAASLYNLKSSKKSIKNENVNGDI
ncbi:conserved hypothetical protein [Thermoanaerobacterium thermosaccharolyticum DSM 571]|uniref:Glycosyltransferase RgtA/B/C/D-like domain-containing protein n=1 Tax=Thermoanaerobacterium thermosaccharolyticum (strain ATCC 7956 / DSM 571 / NCIMB 9385 / NCA 3814 / NCTC 13789 / WDCM 00135 / 2032) TaxID=580327 RepID=D9TMG5_THETC|nr:hypothetical protein [Thermoanaerobacterium thermosaccharolyticum]ADL68453.1 conserved hypothetical protein [Thermoanaerobacterium thermosaccharolyticum DSM 571]